MPGMLSASDLKQLTEQEAIDTVVTVFTDLYGRLVGKRFDVNFFLDTVLKSGTHGCDYLLTVDMEMQPVGGYQFANWEKGYGDFHLNPDLSTLRVADWLERTALVLCDVCQDSPDHSLVSCAPRSILHSQTSRMSDLGFQIMAASELEFFMFQDSYEEAQKNSHHNLRPRGWYIEDYHAMQGARVEDYNGAIRRHLVRSGIPVESTKGEWGHGQHEINVRYSEVLDMADRHAVIKQCMKEHADAMGMSVTFMAKPHEEQAGSSCHIHLSLQQNGRNAFHDSQKGKNAPLFGHVAAGWLKRIPEIMVFLAPTVNSYKRFQPGSWAPTRLAWSHDNRTAALRVVGSGESLRLECRVPGADCNPYLAYAALIAAGLDGINNQLEPPPIFEGDVYATDAVVHVPRTLGDAINLFEKSEFTRTAFGSDVVDHYVHFYRTELDAYERAVTDWERHRYFERI